MSGFSRSHIATTLQACGFGLDDLDQIARDNGWRLELAHTPAGHLLRLARIPVEGGKTRRVSVGPFPISREALTVAACQLRAELDATWLLPMTA